MGKKKTATKITRAVGVKDIAPKAGEAGASVKGGAWYAKFDGVDGAYMAPSPKPNRT